MLNGVSATRANRVNPASVTTRRIAASQPAGRLDPPLEQSLQHALIGEVAQALRWNRLFIDGGEFYLAGHLHVFQFWHIR